MAHLSLQFGPHEFTVAKHRALYHDGRQGVYPPRAEAGAGQAASTAPGPCRLASSWQQRIWRAKDANSSWREHPEREPQRGFHVQLHAFGETRLAAAFATTLAAGVAKAETLVMAIANTPASLDGDQALSAEGEMMMANIHGGDLFLYKIIEQPDKSADSVDLRSTDERRRGRPRCRLLGDERGRHQRHDQSQEGN